MRFTDFLNEWSYTSGGIKKHLQDLGYKFLGNGVDQSAYLEPKTGKVLKVFGAAKDDAKRLDTGHSQDQLMFKAWADYCEKHRNNEFLPRFDAWEGFEWEGKKYLQIRMERLQKLPRELGSALCYLAQIIGNQGKRADADEYVERTVEHIHELVDEFSGYYSDTQANELEKLMVMLGKEKFEELLYTMADIAERGRASGYAFDLHGGNFMHRNNGVPVIVDPWVVE